MPVKKVGAAAKAVAKGVPASIAAFTALIGTFGITEAF